MTVTNFGKNITKIRKENNLTQRAFAETLNVSHATVSKWELNKSVPSHEHITQICDLYSVDANFMYENNTTIDSKTICECMEMIDTKLAPQEQLVLAREIIDRFIEV